MYICPNCKRTSETPVAFCSACGTRMVETQPAPETPAYQAPVAPAPETPAYQAPVAPAPEAPACQAPVTPAPEAPAYQAPVAPAPAAPAYQAPVAPAPEAPAYQAPAAPAYQAPAAPVYQAPAPQYAPPAYQAEVVNKPNKAKSIVGMALGIGGLALAAFGLLYTLIFLSMEAGLAFGYSIGFGIFSMPMSIVGMVISRGNIDAGDESAMSNVGKNLGLVGMILSCVMLFLGFIALLTAL